MDNIIITVVTAVFASTGFWAFVTGFFDRKSAQKELLIGLVTRPRCRLATIPSKSSFKT